MKLFVPLQYILIGVFFTYWWFDSRFLGLGYYLFHIYPIICLMTTLWMKKIIKKSSSRAKIINMIIIILIWLTGVWYISQSDKLLIM